MFGTISADIVDSTSLSAKDICRLQEHLQKFIETFSSNNDEEWGRVVKGDSIEYITNKPYKILRMALLLKCYIRMFIVEDGCSDRFQRYGVRIAMSVGDLRITDKAHGIIDGEAIYLSGRGLSKLSESNTETLSFFSNEKSLDCMNVISALLDAIINKATSRQCGIIYYKLNHLNEREIACKLGIKQPAVNQHASSGCWNAIVKSVTYFENKTF